VAVVCCRKNMQEARAGCNPWAERRRRGRSPHLFASLALVVGFTVGSGLLLVGALAGCGPSSTGGTTAKGETSVSTSLPKTTITTAVITSSTYRITTEPSIGADPLTHLVHGDIAMAGIQVLQAENSGGHGSSPGLLYLRALAEKGQEVTAYQAIAEKMLSLAERYKQQLYFDQLQVVLVAQDGEVLLDHIFQVTPPSSTTSSTQQFITYYSAPSLQVSPREGVRLEVTVSKHSLGTVTATVRITNKSSTTFHFSADDLQLYLNGVRVQPIRSGPRAEFDAGSSEATYIDFDPAQFNPYGAGLLYISSDSQSKGHTARDGPVPTTPG
jgi:hypothetical protein